MSENQENIESKVTWELSEKGKEVFLSRKYSISDLTKCYKEKIIFKMKFG